MKDKTQEIMDLCKKLLREFIRNDCYVLSQDMVEICDIIFNGKKRRISPNSFVRDEKDNYFRRKQIDKIREYLKENGWY